MDHLILPRDPISRPPCVPYLCEADDETDPWDGAAFLSFPDRCESQWAPFSVPNWRLALPVAELRQPIDDRLLEPFLQRWFFFGLLHAFLDKHGLYNYRDYIESFSGRYWVHTKILCGRLKQWQHSMSQYALEDKVKVKTELLECLTHTSHVLRTLWSNTRRSGNSRPLQDSIICICETLSNAAEFTFDDTDEFWPIYDHLTGVNETEKRLMLANGWCASNLPEQTAAMTTPLPFAMRWYMQHLRQPLLEDHDQCDMEHCHNLQIDSARYQPRHNPADCHCTGIGPSSAAVLEALDNATYPVFTIRGNSIETVELELQPYKPGIEYVALSHVWADGLGNPFANSLPRCQLLRIKEMVEALRTQRFASAGSKTFEPSENLAIWCDTLMCPVGESSSDKAACAYKYSKTDIAFVISSNHHKRKALTRMRDVYKNAKYVLVLDQGLQTVSALHCDQTELAVRLLTTPWVSRIWTYQEGSLASKLLLKTADNIIDVDVLIGDALGMSEKNIILRSLGRHLAWQLSLLRNFSDSEADGGIDIETLTLSICERSVTYAADEALVIAAMLDLDLGQVAAHDTLEARMSTLWRLIVESPKGLSSRAVFSTTTKLTTRGYRWAPNSIRKDSEEVFRITSSREGERASISPAGLHVKFPGFRIRLGECSSRSSPLPIEDKMAQDPFCVKIDDAWYVAMGNRDTQQHSIYSMIHEAREKDWVMVLGSKSDLVNIGVTKSEYILGYLEMNETGVSILRQQYVAMLYRLSPCLQVIMSAAEKLVLQIRQNKKLLQVQQLKALYTIIDTACRYMPRRIKSINLLLSIKFLVWMHESLRAALMAELSRQVADVQQSEAVVQAQQVVGFGVFNKFFEKFLVGGISEASQIFGPEHEWCID